MNEGGPRSPQKVVEDYRNGDLSKEEADQELNDAREETQKGKVVDKSDPKM